MPDKEIMLQVRQLEDQLPWNALDALNEHPAEPEINHVVSSVFADTLRQLAGDWRMLADLYDRAKLKGAKTTYIEPLRHAAVQLDRVIKQLEQPRRAPLGQLQPTSGPPAHESAGLDEPRHRFNPGEGGVCHEFVQRNGVEETCGRYASHPAHRLDGPTERPGLDALIAEATGALTVNGVEVSGASMTMHTVPTESSITPEQIRDLVTPDFPGQASGDEVAAYLRGEIDDIPGAPPLAPSSVRDRTEWRAEDGPELVDIPAGTLITSARELKERASAVATDPAAPPVPLLGQPGDAGSGYSPTYVPPGGVPLTYAELLTPVPYASLPPHLSHSQIETIADCPTKYRAQRLDSVPREGGPVTQIPQWALIGGNAFHAAVESIERDNLPNGLVPELIWKTAFEAECARIEATSPVPRSRWRASKQGAEGETWWNVNGPEMLRRYLAARPDEPTAQFPRQHEDGALDHAAIDEAIELERTVKVPTAYGPIDYRAILDRVAVRIPDGAYSDSYTETLIIRDYKTGDRMPGDTSQLGEYAQVLRLIGVPPRVKILGTFFNARKGTWTPEVDLEAAGWTAEWFTYVVTSGHAQRLALTQGPTPARPSSFCGGCSVRWACPIKGVKS